MSQENLNEDIQKLVKKHPGYLIFACEKDLTVKELFEKMY